MHRRATDAVQLLKLGDVVTVSPGFSAGTSLEHDPDGSHVVILTRHLVPGLPYVYEPDDELRITPGRAPGKYEVQEGDVLLVSRGTRNVASWVEALDAPTIVPVSFYILRPMRTGDAATVDPSYLTWYLNQPLAQRAIAQIRTGAGTPLVQRAGLEELRVPVPAAEEQRRIGQLGLMMARERLLLDRLVAATARAHGSTSAHLAGALAARGGGAPPHPSDFDTDAS